MYSDWKLTKKAKRIMSILNSLIGSSGPSNNIAANTGVPITSGLLAANTTNQAQWNAAQAVQAQSSYPYIASEKRSLHVVVKQVENGYILEVGGTTLIASNLKEITEVITNRVASTLLDWNA